MKRLAPIATLAAALLFAASSALAGNCPVQMKAIDAALPKAKLDAGKTAEVKKLRADGERFHKEGKHAESMKDLGDAKKLLGI